MALVKKELYQLLQILSVPVKYDATVSDMTIALKLELARRRNESAPSSAYATPASYAQPQPYGDPTITQAPLFGQAPASTQAPTITQAPANIKRSSIFGPPVIAHASPPDPPPLTDSDDDIVITVEPM